MLNFMRAPYWLRHWITREVFFSKDRLLVLYGDHELDWSEVVNLS